ncbi:MAG: tetratricopeptide repeat protein, partial [Candidatus Limnocylindrales bacterium]
MTESLYERYKDALRRGHVAAQRSRSDLALDAYGEAARLAPDRALPFIGIGSILTKLDRTDEALAAYDAALERAPSDETALRARAELLTASGDRVAAAETLDRLA